MTIVFFEEPICTIVRLSMCPVAIYAQASWSELNNFLHLTLKDSVAEDVSSVIFMVNNAIISSHYHCHSNSRYSSATVMLEMHVMWCCRACYADLWFDADCHYHLLLPRQDSGLSMLSAWFSVYVGAQFLQMASYMQGSIFRCVKLWCFAMGTLKK